MTHAAVSTVESAKSVEVLRMAKIAMIPKNAKIEEHIKFLLLCVLSALCGKSF
jgi:hypothetical protein